MSELRPKLLRAMDATASTLDAAVAEAVARTVPAASEEAREADLRARHPTVFDDLDQNVHGLAPDKLEEVKRLVIRRLMWEEHPERHAADSMLLLLLEREAVARVVLEAASDPERQIDNMIDIFSEMWSREARQQTGTMRLDLEQVVERMEAAMDRMEAAQDSADTQGREFAGLLDRLRSQMSTPGQTAPPPQSAPPPHGMPKAPLAALSDGDRRLLLQRWRTWAAEARTTLNGHVQSDLATRIRRGDDAATQCAKKRTAYAKFLGKGVAKQRRELKKLQKVPKLPAKCLPARNDLTELQELVLGCLEELCGKEADAWFEKLDPTSDLRGIESGLGSKDIPKFLKQLAPNLQQAISILYIAQRSANPGGTIVSNKSGEAGPGSCKGPNYKGAPGQHPSRRVLRDYGEWLNDHAAHARSTGCDLDKEEAIIRVLGIIERPRARRLQLELTRAPAPYPY